MFQAAGLPTAKFWNVASIDDECEDLEFPVIVKPKMEAVSHGIRIVANEADLREDWPTRQVATLGFHVVRLPRAGIGDVLVLRNHHEDSDDVMLPAHLDTGTPADEWAPYREDARRLYGTGAAESKGGIAVALAALRALRHAGALRRRRVALLVTTDGSASGAAARSITEDESAEARFVIGLKAGAPSMLLRCAEPVGPLVIKKAVSPVRPGTTRTEQAEGDHDHGEAEEVPEAKCRRR